MCDKYFIEYHRTELCQILENRNELQHFPVNIHFIELFDNDPNLGNKILNDFDNVIGELENEVQEAQNILIAELQANGKYASIKQYVHCRIYGLPAWSELQRSTFPKNCDAEKFLQIFGTVIRISVAKLLEFKREYVCKKCKYKFICEAEYERKNIILPPKKCRNPLGDCNGTIIVPNCSTLQSKFCKDYQEVKLQENISQLGFGSVPSSIWVTLDNDLVDICKPGDNVTICGIVKRRWSPFVLGKKTDIELVVKANHVTINNTCGSQHQITPEIKEVFRAFWENYKDVPVIGRDIILKSFCPQIFGLHLVKLAMAVVLAGGSQASQDYSSGVRIRSEPHLLLVGDPGTGKSQLLRFASKVVPRSVLTTGIGSTAAGLTVTAMIEDGEWQLEGGALVLADGGICCIDEFNSMKEHDRASIHEAMEQQTISVAKASIVCKLRTKCSILAATNPKGNIDPMQPLCMNIALASPLVSRFDLIFLIRDTVQQDWDTLVADYILDDRKTNVSKFTKNENWSLEMLQAYFNVIKKINPTLTEEANRIIGSYYQSKRRQNFRNKSRTTARLLDSLVRLSQGHARLLYHDSVQTVDAVMAVVLVEIGMGYQEETLLNLNMNIHSSVPENSLGNYTTIVNEVLEKLDLLDILEQEMSLLERCENLEENSGNIRVESRHFNDLGREQRKSNVDVQVPSCSGWKPKGTNSNTESREGMRVDNNKFPHSSQLDRGIFQDDNIDHLVDEVPSCSGWKQNGKNSNIESRNEIRDDNNKFPHSSQFDRSIFQDDNIDDFDLDTDYSSKTKDKLNTEDSGEQIQIRQYSDPQSEENIPDEDFLLDIDLGSNTEDNEKYSRKKAEIFEKQCQILNDTEFKINVIQDENKGHSDLGPTKKTYIMSCSQLERNIFQDEDMEDLDLNL